MKLRWIKAVFVIVVVCFTVSSHGDITAGGEIPWPLAHQYEITPENSRGLWKLEQKTGLKYYNVEILDQVGGTTFIRVSELDSETLKVVSWGEGFFKESSKKTATDFWSIYLDADKIASSLDVGRYLYMYPNGDISKRAHMIRLVEIRTVQSISLGLSIFSAGISVEDKEHILGARMQEKPLDCRIDDDALENLTCDFPSKASVEEK